MKYGFLFEFYSAYSVHPITHGVSPPSVLAINLPWEVYKMTIKGKNFTKQNKSKFLIFEINKLIFNNNELKLLLIQWGEYKNLNKIHFNLFFEIYNYFIIRIELSQILFHFGCTNRRYILSYEKF